MKRFTPEKITELQENEIFVFGSNLNGNHAGGAAKLAVEKFGAIEGQGEGLQGQSYAIPTLNKEMQKVSAEEMKASLVLFADFASKNEQKTFLLTKIGCGIAGFQEDEIINILKEISLPENVIIPECFQVTISYKGTDKEMKCRDYQYEIGKREQMDERPSICNRGFHSCKHPLDVLSFYPNRDGNRYFEAENIGEVRESTDGDTKIASRSIELKAEIGIPGLVKASVGYVFSVIKKVKPATTGNEAHSATTGYKAHSATTGNEAHSATTGSYAHSATTGSYAHSATTGNEAHSATTGNEAHSATTGYEAHSATTGNKAHSATTGYKAHSATTGYKAHSATTGYKAHSATTGNEAHSATTGYEAHSATTGYEAHSATTGSYAHSATTGYKAHSATTGSYAHSATTGNEAHSATTGYECISAGLGRESKAKAALGSWIVLSEWTWDDKAEKHVIKAVKTAKIDGKKLKPNTYYILENGKFKESN